MRDAILYFPALLGLLVAVLAGVRSSEPLWRDATDHSMQVGMALVVFLGATSGAVFALGLLWLGWALVVLAVAGVLGVARRAPIRLRALPLPWLEQPERFARWIPSIRPLPLGRRAPWSRRDVIPLLVVLGLMWLAESVVGVSAMVAGRMGVEALLASLALVTIGCVLVWYPTSFALAGARFVVDRSARVLARLLDLRGSAEIRRGEPDLQPVQVGRKHVRGRAEATNESRVVAPLSGRSCLAFRLVGRACDLLVDDADAVSFVVVEQDGRATTARATHWLVVVPVADPTSLALDEAQRVRVARFLEPRIRGVPLDDVELAESCICEGDTVEIWGADGNAPIESAYRGAERTEPVLSDADAKPVVIRAEPALAG